MTKPEKQSARNPVLELSHNSRGHTSEIKVWQGPAPSEGAGEGLPLTVPLASAGLLPVSGVPGLLGTSPHFHLYCHTSVSQCPLFIRTTVMLDQGPTQLQDGLISTNYICNKLQSKLDPTLRY